MSNSQNIKQTAAGAHEKSKVRLNRESLRIFNRIWIFIKPYSAWFWGGLVFLALSTLTVLTFPYLTGELVNAATGAPTFASLKLNTIAMIMAAILILQSIFSFFRIYSFAKVSEQAMSDIRTSLFSKMITLSVPFFEKRRVGELTSRITSDVAKLQDMLSLAIAEFLRQIATLIIGISFLLWLSAKLTILMLAVIPVLAISAMYFGRFIRKLARKRQDALADSNTVAEETLQNIGTVKAFTNETYERDRYQGYQQKVVHFALRAAKFRGLFTSFIIFAMFGGIVLVLWFGALLVSRGEMNIGDLTAFIFYTMFIGGSISGMGELYARLQRSLGASERVFEIMDESAELEIDQKKVFTRARGTVSFEDINFAYPTRPDTQVLHDFNLQVNTGQKVALAGQSGAGKSTVIGLLMNFYDVQNGEIKVDNKPVQHWGKTELRANIALVPQEVMLFGGSIGENIAYGKPGATALEIEEAASKAHAMEFIERFPEGMETVVGERGVKLSGGQRQRIAIARAILKDPAILVLDEATSSLDAESEYLVQDALEGLMHNRSTIIIAHRLSTIRNVNRIYVMDQGRVAESGTYDELSQKPDGIFKKLLKLQFEETSTPTQ